jgi:ubiquinone biosynthesis protein
MNLAWAPTLARRKKPRPWPHHVLGRGLLWSWEGLRLVLALGLDRLAGKSDPRSMGRRLRRMFERVGGTAIKAGQQLAIRVDLLPYEVCEELGVLMDRVAAFPAEHAITRVEAAIGGPLNTVFESFDPDPIGSASVACVFQARLKSGEKVAVKVRRPGVFGQFAADLACFDILTWLMEFVTIVRPGMFRHLRTELSSMLLEELDFTAEARYQRLFRKETREQGLDWVTAPRVFSRLCTEDVLVTEFIEGISCIELLAACETGDEAALATLKRMDIDPIDVAKRVIWLCYWGRFETPFFHGDPHPGNIIVMPGSDLVMLDFGACSTTTFDERDSALEMCKRAVQDDPSGMAAVAISESSPLPHINITRFRGQAEGVFHDMATSMRDPRAGWWEKTSAGMWLGFVEAAAEHQIPVNLDTLRMIRSTLLYDTLSLRLHPDGTYDEFERYLGDATGRMADRGRKAVTQRLWLTSTADTVQNMVRMAETTEYFANAFRMPSAASLSATAYFVRHTLQYIVIFGVGLAMVAFGLQLKGVPGSLYEHAWAVMTHPIGWVAGSFTLWLYLRRMQFRLSDVRRY